MVDVVSSCLRPLTVLHCVFVDTEPSGLLTRDPPRVGPFFVWFVSVGGGGNII